jgi:predicted dehydrogenase
VSRLAIALVGAGARSRIWRRVIDADPRTTLAGLADTDPAALAGETLPTAATLEALLERTPADAVILATPPARRDSQIAAACAARLPILAEKPLADSLAAATAHVATAAAAGAPLMVGLNFRYLAVTCALRALIADTLGPPEVARFTYERWRDGRRPNLNRYPLAMPQPMLWEQSIHHFDLMRHVYRAEPVRIAARTSNPSWSMYAGDANVAALIDFEGGLTVTYHGTWAGNWDRLGFDWRTDCARGVAIQAEMFGGLGYALRDDPALTPVALPPAEPWADDAAALLAAFVAHVLDGAPLECSGADHLKSLRMVEAAIRASATGQSISMADPTLAAEPVGRTPPQVQPERRMTP